MDRPSNPAALAYICGNMRIWIPLSGRCGKSDHGFHDPLGRAYDRWGSNDANLQGVFDVAGLEIPDGEATSSYELTVEQVDQLTPEK